MFKWKNKFSMETLLNAELNYTYDINDVVKVNNQYFATLNYNSYNVEIKLTKKEDKITKMKCNCKSRKKNCIHLAETLYFIETYEIPEKTFKHNSITKYPKLTDVQFEKYLEEDLQNINEEELREFLINILIDYEKLYKNYVLSFKNELTDNDIDIILKKLNNILKVDIGFTMETDKFYEKIQDFLYDEMSDYSYHEEIASQLYMKIYEKIVSVKYLSDPLDYSLLLEEINNNIITILKISKAEYAKYVKNELNRLINEYPETLFSSQMMQLMGKLADEDDYETNINLLIKQIEDTYDEEEKEKYLDQLQELMEKSNYSDEKIISNLERFNDNYHAVSLIIQYHLKNNEIDSAIVSVEKYLLETTSNDDIYPALIDLKNLQYMNKNLENYEAILFKLICDYYYYNETDFDNLKNEASDYDEFKEDVIDVYKQTSLHNLLEFYIFNNMIKEFEEIIFKYPDINILKEYQDILVKTSKNKLLETYEKMIYELLTVAKRSKYRKVAKILGQMREIPGTQNTIKRIKKDLKIKYPQRKALFSEIENI